MPPLYILRHGETDWNATGRLQGRFDSPLTQRGVAQAKAQNSILGRHDLAGFKAISSPQGRAFRTAEIALEGVCADIQTDARLSEIGLGDWAGMDRGALIRSEKVRSGFDLYERAPNGEGFDVLYARCDAFLGTLTGPSVLVTHGITSRMLRVILLGKSLAELRKIEGGQGIVFYLENRVQKLLRERA
ncbi:histidine phosphatase family protein [Sulfitobacter sp. SK012]|nr:histidine phosphatase family protein [Sulfitobacter sp. SK012]